MHRIANALFILSIVLISTSFGLSSKVYAAVGDVNVIHSFTAQDTMGDYLGTLSLIDGKIYGSTAYGGVNNYGSLFAIDTDGSNYMLLHSFDLISSVPYFGPIMHNTKLYGISSDTIYSVNTNGSEFTTLKTLNGSTGQFSYAPLFEFNERIYGITGAGGANNGGTLYAMNFDGTNYEILFNFPNSYYATGKPLFLNNKFYGKAYYGENHQGSIYSINTDGTNYQLLHSFGAGNDGSYGYGSLTYFNNRIYGTTSSGGPSGRGIIFSINLDGSDYQIIHDFGTDGWADGTLVNYGTKLYGVTDYGGANSKGVIFSINGDGSEYTVLHTFSGTPNDGASPQNYDAPLIIGNKMYIITGDGGTTNNGAIVTYELPDITPPVISNISPISGSIFTSKNQTITFDTDEAASCRASITDKSYDEMVSDIVCTGTQHKSCSFADLGSNGAKTVYFACSDASNNKHTSATNTEVAYTLSVPVPTPSPTVRVVKITTVPTATPTPTPTETISIVTPTVTFTVTPTATTTQTFTIQDESGNILVGAIVTISGTQYTSDSNGKIEVNPSIASSKIVITYQGQSYIGSVLGTTKIIAQKVDETTPFNWGIVVLSLIIICIIIAFVTWVNRKR